MTGYASLDPFPDFEQFCLDQGVRLNEQVASRGRSGRSSLPFNINPSGLHAALAETGQVLRADPNAKLASGLITPPNDFWNQFQSCHVARSTLIRAINASQEPLPRGQRGLGSDFNVDYVVPSCITAEERFCRAIAQMHQPGVFLPGLNELQGCQIIVDDQGEAVALRKAIGSALTLTLTDGPIYPAGSLLHMETAGDVINKYGSVCDIIVPRQETTRRHLEADMSGSFLRLSAFAISPWHRREEFAAVWDRVQTEHRDVKSVFRSFGIEAVRDTVQEALATTPEFR